MSRSIPAWPGGRGGNGWARNKGDLWLGQRPGLVALGRVGQSDMPPVKSCTESYTTPPRPPLAAYAVHAPIDTAPAALQHPRGRGDNFASGVNASARERGGGLLQPPTPPPSSLGPPTVVASDAWDSPASPGPLARLCRGWGGGREGCDDAVGTGGKRAPTTSTLLRKRSG